MIQNNSLNRLTPISEVDIKLDKKPDEKLTQSEPSDLKKYKPKEKTNNLAMEEDLDSLNGFEVSDKKMEKVETIIDKVKEKQKLEQEDHNSLKDICNNLRGKEPREQLNQLMQVQTKTEKGEKELKGVIADLKKSHLKDFSLGLNKNNIKDFVSTAKEVTKHDGLFKTDRLIKSFYTSLDNLSSLYTKVKFNKNDYIKEISEVINTGNKFIKDNEGSTRKHWVKEIVSFLEKEKEKVENKAEILSLIKNEDKPENLIKLLKQAYKEKIDIKNELNFDKIYKVFTNSNKDNVDNIVNLTMALADNDYNFANDIILKAYQDKKINYFELFSCSIQVAIASPGEKYGNAHLMLSANFDLLESKKDFPLNKELKTLNSLMRSFYSLNNGAEVDSILINSEILSKLDNKQINQILELSSKKSLNIFDNVTEKVKSIIGDKIDLNNKQGKKAFEAIVNYVSESNTLNILKNKEPREQLHTLRNTEVKTEEGKKLKEAEINKFIGKHLGEFSRGLNDNASEFLNTVKEVTKHDGVFKTDRLIKNFYSSLENLSKTYSLDDSKYEHLDKKLKVVEKSIDEAEKFIKNNPKSTGLEWVKESLKILKTEQINLSIKALSFEEPQNDNEYIKLNGKESLEKAILLSNSILKSDTKVLGADWIKNKLDSLNTDLNNTVKQMNELPEIVQVRGKLKKVEKKDFDEVQRKIAKEEFLQEKKDDLKLFKENRKIEKKDVELPSFISDKNRLKAVYNNLYRNISENKIKPSEDKEGYKNNIIESFKRVMKSNNPDIQFNVALMDMQDFNNIFNAIVKDLKIPKDLKMEINSEMLNSFINDRNKLNKDKSIIFNGQRYKHIKKLGEGAFGSAILVENDNGEKLVAKFQKKNNNKMIQKETSILKYTLQDNGQPHKNVLGFRGVIAGNDTECPITLTDVANGGELRDVMNKIRLDKKTTHNEKVMIEKYLLRNVLEGMKYLQEERHIKHLDLKPENIFFDKETMLPKIADFGLSSIGLEEQDGFKGTPLYVAPEMFLQQNINSKTDNWSLGVIIHEMVLGKRPDYLDGVRSKEDIIDNILDRDYIKSFDQDGNIQDTTSFGRVINALMDKNKEKRPSISSILESTFFKDTEKDDEKVKELLAKILN